MEKYYILVHGVKKRTEYVLIVLKDSLVRYLSLDFSMSGSESETLRRRTKYILCG